MLFGCKTFSFLIVYIFCRFWYIANKCVAFICFSILIFHSCSCFFIYDEVSAHAQTHTHTFDDNKLVVGESLTFGLVCLCRGRFIKYQRTCCKLRRMLSMLFPAGRSVGRSVLCICFISVRVWFILLPPSNPSMRISGRMLLLMCNTVQHRSFVWILHGLHSRVTGGGRTEQE